MADMLKNSLINSNNLLGSNVNISTKKSIIKSDSKIKSRNHLAEQNNFDLNQSNVDNRSVNNPKPKSVKIAMVPR